MCLQTGRADTRSNGAANYNNYNFGFDDHDADAVHPSGVRRPLRICDVPAATDSVRAWNFPREYAKLGWLWRVCLLFA